MRDGANDPVSESEATLLFGALSEFPALVLAVSGGPDSTALLWLAARWRNSLERAPKLVAVTVDHGLRKESAQEATAVKRLANKLKVEHRTLRWTGAKPKTGIQAAAREARYRLLSVAAHNAKAGHVVTAHTLDDQAETVLFRLLRGSGVSGLAGMSDASRVPVEEGRDLVVLRPLLATPKARLIATLDSAGVAYARDPSNSDPRFARPRLRRDLLPALSREGLTIARLGRLARRVERVDEVLWQAFKAARAALCPEPWPARGSLSVDRRAFTDLPAEIGVRLLTAMIAHVGREGAPELGQLEALHAHLVYPTAGVPPGRVRRTLGGALVTLATSTLTVERAPPRRSGAKPRASGAKPRASGAKAGKSTRKGPFTKAR